MPTPTEELAALTLELQRRGVIDVKFSWRPGAVEGLPASECMKGAADFIAEYLSLQEPTLASRAEAATIERLQAENQALRRAATMAKRIVDDECEALGLDRTKNSFGWDAKVALDTALKDRP